MNLNGCNLLRELVMAEDLNWLRWDLHMTGSLFHQIQPKIITELAALSQLKCTDIFCDAFSKKKVSFAKLIIVNYPQPSIYLTSFCGIVDCSSIVYISGCSWLWREPLKTTMNFFRTLLSWYLIETKYHNACLIQSIIGNVSRKCQCSINIL